MVSIPVPDFFQDESSDSLRSQADWLVRHIGLDDSFFAKLLDTDDSTIADWRQRGGNLSHPQEEIFRQFWRTILHLLSFLNLDDARLRELFLQSFAARPVARPSTLLPAWSGESLKTYLEREREHGIPQVDRWFTGFRFGRIEP